MTPVFLHIILQNYTCGMHVQREPTSNKNSKLADLVVHTIKINIYLTCEHLHLRQPRKSAMRFATTCFNVSNATTMLHLIWNATHYALTSYWMHMGGGCICLKLSGCSSPSVSVGGFQPQTQALLPVSIIDRITCARQCRAVGPRRARSSPSSSGMGIWERRRPKIHRRH